MHTIVYVLKRKSGLSKQDFMKYYTAHREVILKYSRGLVNYTQYPVREKLSIGDFFIKEHSYDALSIYTFNSPEDAEYSTHHNLIKIDGEKFIDTELMISLPVVKNVVFSCD